GETRRRLAGTTACAPVSVNMAQPQAPERIDPQRHPGGANANGPTDSGRGWEQDWRNNADMGLRVPRRPRDLMGASPSPVRSQSPQHSTHGRSTPGGYRSAQQ